MDSKEFIALLKDHEKVSHQSVEELKKLSLEYPYSQPVQLLYAIRLSQSSEYLFNRQLGKTSILTDDRSVLFDLFEREQEEEPPRPESAIKSVVENAPAPPAPVAEQAVEETALEPGESEPVEELTQEEARPEEAEPIRMMEEEPQESQQEVKEAQQPEVEAPRQEEAPKSGPAPEVVLPEKPMEKPRPAAPVAANTAQYAGLSPKERIKAILEENRRLREEFEKGKTTSGEGANSEINQRIREIRENFDKVKRTEKPETEESPEVEEVSKAFTEPERATIEAPVEEPIEPVFFEATETAQESVQEEEPQTVEESPRAEEGDEDSVADTMPFEIDAEEEENSAEVPEEPAAEPVKDIEPEPVEEASGPSVKKAPLPNGDEKHSFGGWLQRLKDERAREGEGKGAAKVERPSGPIGKKLELLDSFVEKLPELKKNRPVAKAEKASVDMGHLQEEDGSLVTETLARVYLKQQHYQKAIKAYEILKLKYPEKNTFFADQISEIKELINSK